MKNSLYRHTGFVIRREIDRMLHDRVYLFIAIIAPVIGFAMITMIFSSNVPRKLPVDIVDQDHTSLSRKIARVIEATPIAAPNSRCNDLNQAWKALVAGKTDAIVCIPAGTERKIMRGEHADVAIYLNNVYLIKAGLLKSGIYKALATLSAGIKMQAHLAGGEASSLALAKIQAIQLNPVLLFNPFTSYEYYLSLLLIPVMLTVFILFGTIYALGTELQYGSAPNWLQTAGLSMVPAIIGKLAPHTILYAILAMVMNLLFFRILGLPLRGHYPIIVVSELTLILAYQAMAIFIVTLSRNLRLALSLASAYTMLAITFAGMTFPAFGMPAIAQIFGKIFPFTWWLDIFVGQTLRGEPLANGISHLWILSLFILAGFCLTPRLKYLLKTKHFWGKI